MVKKFCGYSVVIIVLFLSLAILGNKMAGAAWSNVGYITLAKTVLRTGNDVQRSISYDPPRTGERTPLEQAEKAFGKAVQWDSGSGKGYTGMGQTLIWQGRYAEAVAYLEEAVRLGGLARYGHLAGNANMYAGDRKRAFELWMNVNPAPDARWYLATTIFNQSRWDYYPERREDATYVLEETLKQSDLDSSTVVRLNDTLADMFDQMGQLDRAEQAIRDAVAARPEDAVYRSRLAWVLKNAAKANEALREAQASLDLQPNWRAHFVRGTIYSEQCQLEAAAREFEIGLQLPAGGDYRYWWQILYLGDIYWEQGRVADALGKWEQYLQFQSGHVSVRDQVAWAKRGELPKRCGKP